MTCECSSAWSRNCPLHGYQTNYYRSMQTVQKLFKPDGMVCKCYTTAWSEDCPLHGYQSDYYRSMQQQTTKRAPIKPQQNHIHELIVIGETLAEIDETIRKGNVVMERIGESLTNLNRNMEVLIRVQERHR